MCTAWPPIANNAATTVMVEACSQQPFMHSACGVIAMSRCSSAITRLWPQTPIILDTRYKAVAAYMHNYPTMTRLVTQIPTISGRVIVQVFANANHFGMLDIGLWLPICTTTLQLPGF